MNDEVMNVGNISTIAQWTSVILLPIIINYGVEIDQETLTTFIYALIMICISIWSSYNPNTFAFLKNNKQECECIIETEEDLVNEEYEEEVIDDEGC